MERNAYGAWVAVPQNQTEATDMVQVVANRDDIEEQRQTQVISSEQNVVGRQNETQSQAMNIFTLKRWKIETTIDRVQICLWTLILITKIFSILAVISFWIAVFFWLKSLPAWEGPQRIFNGYMYRRDAAANNVALRDDEAFLHDVFPGVESLMSYQLSFVLTDSGFHPSRAVFAMGLALLLKNPVTWLIIMIMTFACYHVSSFVHDCLRQASRAAGTLAKRRRTA